MSKFTDDLAKSLAASVIAQVAPRVLGLAADHPGAGKDTAFEVLKEANPGTEFVNVKFADALTDEVYALFSHAMPKEEFLEYRNDPMLKDKPLFVFRPANILLSSPQGNAYFEFLFERYAEKVRSEARWSVRDHLLIYGTEFVRKHLGQENKWLDLGLQKVAEVVAAGAVAVVTDVRFPNEAKGIKEIGGQIAHVALEGAVNAGLDKLTSIAENKLKGWDFDLNVKNVWGKPKDMGVQFNAKYTW